MEGEYTREVNSEYRSKVISSVIEAGMGGVKIGGEGVRIIGSEVMSGGGGVEIEGGSKEVEIEGAKEVVRKSRVIEEGDMKINIGIGNLYVDTYYSVDRANEARERYLQARDTYKEMQELEREGRASGRAVEEARVSMVAAEIEMGVAVGKGGMNIYRSVKGIGDGSMGMYGDVRVGVEGERENRESMSERIVGSVIESRRGIEGRGIEEVKGKIKINSDGDVDIKSSIINEVGGGGIEIESRKGDVNIGGEYEVEREERRMEEVRSNMTVASTDFMGYEMNFFEGIGIGEKKGEESYEGKRYVGSMIKSYIGGAGEDAGGGVGGEGSSRGRVKISSFGDLGVIGSRIESEDVSIEVGGDMKLESVLNEGYGYSSGREWNSSSNIEGIGFDVSRGSSLKKWVGDIGGILGSGDIGIDVGGELSLKGGVIGNVREGEIEEGRGKVDLRGVRAEGGEERGSILIEVGSLRVEEIKEEEMKEERSIGMDIYREKGEDLAKKKANGGGVYANGGVTEDRSSISNATDSRHPEFISGSQGLGSQPGSEAAETRVKDSEENKSVKLKDFSWILGGGIPSSGAYTEYVSTRRNAADDGLASQEFASANSAKSQGKDSILDRNVGGMDGDDSKIRLKHLRSEKEGIIRSTIGAGEIVIRGGGSAGLENLNRDMSKIEEITKDRIEGGLNAEVSLGGVKSNINTIGEVVSGLPGGAECALEKYKWKAESTETPVKQGESKMENDLYNGHDVMALQAGSTQVDVIGSAKGRAIGEMLQIMEYGVIQPMLHLYNPDKYKEAEYDVWSMEYMKDIINDVSNMMKGSMNIGIEVNNTEDVSRYLKGEITKQDIRKELFYPSDELSIPNWKRNQKTGEYELSGGGMDNLDKKTGKEEFIYYTRDFDDLDQFKPLPWKQRNGLKEFIKEDLFGIGVDKEVKNAE